MKRFLVLTVLTVTAVAASARPASAWTNFRFRVGMNITWQSAGNCVLWGLIRTGPAPAPWNFAPGCPYDGAAGFYPSFAPADYHSYSPTLVRQATTTPASPTVTSQEPPMARRPTTSVTPTSAVLQPVGYFAGPAPSYWYGQ
jgi:hypothetical protein